MDINTATIVQAYWPVLVSTILFVVWCSSLQSELRYLKKDRDEVRQSTTSREAVLWGKLDYLQLTVTELVRTVAKLEGKLENKGELKDKW